MINFDDNNLLPWGNLWLTLGKLKFPILSYNPGSNSDCIDLRWNRQTEYPSSTAQQFINFTCQPSMNFVYYGDEVSCIVDSLQCFEPKNVYTSNITSNSAKLNWQDPGTSAGYELRVRDLSGGSWVSLPVSGTQKTISGLTPYTWYEWQVRSECSGTPGQYSLWSALQHFQTDCSASDSILTTDITPTSAKLRWTTIQGAAGYQIRGRKVGGPWVYIAINSGTQGSKNVGGLQPNNTYEWQISTDCDGAGTYSSYSSLTSFTTPSSARLDASVTTQNGLPFTEENTLSVYPNPTQGQLLVDLNISSEQELNWKVRDLSGREMLMGTYAALPGSQQFSLDLQQLPSGMYFLEVESAEGVMTARIRVVD